MKTLAASTMVETLIPIWKQVLRLSFVGADDNFFDLGGDSALTLELFHEIALATGRALPPVMIYHAPTISDQAALLEQPTDPVVPPLVRLRAGSDHPPLFITHGLGGSVMDLYQVAKRIQTQHSIHGLQARGIDGIEKPMDRIEDMARYSLDAVKQLQPCGPYYLIGFSLGGLVTLEMARQLVERGETIGLLLMLDSYPHVSRLSRKLRARLAARQTWRWATRRLKWLGVKHCYETSIDVPPSASLQRCRESAMRALERYEPRFYPGKIRFVRAANPTKFPHDPAAVWSGLAKELEVETVPGDHLGIMTTHCDRLARAVSRYLREAFREWDDGL